MKRLTPGLLRQALSHALQAGSARGYTLEPAHRRDLAALLDVGARCFSYNPPTRRELRYAITRAHAAVIVLRETKTGTIGGFAIYEFNLGQYSLYENLVCLVPSWRGKGLSRPFDAIRDALARTLGCRYLRAHVSMDNRRKIRMMRKQGYTALETIPDYYSNGKAAILFRKALGAEDR